MVQNLAIVDKLAIVLVESRRKETRYYGCTGQWPGIFSKWIKFRGVSLG
jgi:hypothetical protein